jgi:hypothetical protein
MTLTTRPPQYRSTLPTDGPFPMPTATANPAAPSAQDSKEAFAGSRDLAVFVGWLVTLMQPDRLSALLALGQESQASGSLGREGRRLCYGSV